jgi:hypothetical protein
MENIRADLTASTPITPSRSRRHAPSDAQVRYHMFTLRLSGILRPNNMSDNALINTDSARYQWVRGSPELVQVPQAVDFGLAPDLSECSALEELKARIERQQ